MREERVPAPQFVLCVDNEGYEVDLEVNKLYEALPDPEWERRGCVRVIDESGQDYVYSRSYFAFPEAQPPAAANARLRGT
jgi:hypothetical protein